MTYICEECGLHHPEHVDVKAQHELVAMLVRDGVEPESMICRSCGAIYDGGMRCTYCGDPNPLGADD